jgi:hypothetical protein
VKEGSCQLRGGLELDHGRPEGKEKEGISLIVVPIEMRSFSSLAHVTRGENPCMHMPALAVQSRKANSCTSAVLYHGSSFDRRSVCVYLPQNVAWPTKLYGLI